MFESEKMNDCFTTLISAMVNCAKSNCPSRIFIAKMSSIILEIFCGVGFSMERAAASDASARDRIAISGVTAGAPP